jgi:hypothetical protein
VEQRFGGGGIEAQAQKGWGCEAYEDWGYRWRHQRYE